MGREELETAASKRFRLGQKLTLYVGTIIKMLILKILIYCAHKASIKINQQ